VSVSTLVSDTQDKSGLSARGKVTFGALVGLASGLVYAQAVIERAVSPVPTVNAAIVLLLAAALAAGWRKSPYVVAGWMGFMLLGSLQVILPRFAHPEDTHMFVWNAITLALALVAFGGGVMLTVQRRRQRATGI
jgi:hypothetical protein